MIQPVLETFSMSLDEFNEFQASCQHFLQDMNRPEKIKIRTQMFPYLDLLDPSISVYAQFGADKCSISNFKKWCELLDTPDQDSLHFVSRDKKITFTCHTIQDDYIHYLGVTGELEKVLYAFSLFLEMGHYTDLSWGNRDFI